MIPPREECARIVAPLIEHDGITRVLVAHADGVAHFDTATLDSRERGAAAAAMAAGTAAVIGGGLGVPAVQGLVVYGAEEQVISRPVGQAAVLMVVAAVGTRGDGVYPLVRRIGRELEGALAR